MRLGVACTLGPLGHVGPRNLLRTFCVKCDLDLDFDTQEQSGDGGDGGDGGGDGTEVLMSPRPVCYYCARRGLPWSPWWMEDDDDDDDDEEDDGRVSAYGVVAR